MFGQPPGGDGNDPNKPNNYTPRTPTDSRKGPGKAPGAPKKTNSKRDRFALADKNDADLDNFLQQTGEVNPGVFEAITKEAQSRAPARGLFGDRPTQSASPSGFGFGIGMNERRTIPRITSDPSIGIDDLERRARSLSIDPDSNFNTPVSSPSSSRSGSPPGAPRKEKKYPSSKGGMSRKSKKSRGSKKSRKPKKSKKTKKSKKNRKSRKSRKHK